MDKGQAGISQSVQPLGRSWIFQGLNPGGCEIYHDIGTCLKAQPVSCTVSAGPFSGVNCPKLCAD